MSDQKKQAIKRVLRADDESLNELQSWDLPVVDAGNEVEDGYTNAIGKPLGWVYEPPEPEEEAPQPLTAEDIEEIRQTAYEDGFNEGKENGVEQGILEGREQGHKEGIDIGKEEGYEEGLAQGKGVIDEKIDIWNQLTEQLHQPLRLFDDAAEAELLCLSVELARAVIKTELQLNPQILLATLKDAVSSLPINQSELSIHLNAEDLSLVQDAYGEQELQKRQWTLIAEPSLARGDCEIKTQSSSVSYTIAERTTEILDRFLQDANSIGS